MKYLFILVICLATVAIHAQTQGAVGLHRKSGGNLPFNPSLKPFYHGVASGDPLADRVIIWTRVTPDKSETVNMEWKVFSDTALTALVKSGTATTDSSKDFTVKVDVTGLAAGTTYYYVFRAYNTYSPVGRVRTASTGNVSHLRFAVVSCNNYEAGFFNGFARIAERNDLDAVIHLGDYIYEYAQKQYGDSTTGRYVEPENEVVTEGDYRIRYSMYRLDSALQAAHRQQTFISIWDDHESANDSYEEGAANHQPSTEGDWQTRKAVSKKVYFEWMPIRDYPSNVIYRTVNYGNLADLILLDTRLEGRSQPPVNYDDPDTLPRTMLGAAQYQWFINQLTASKAKWKVVGNQVLFSTTNVGLAARNAQGQPAPNDITAIRSLENNFVYNWEGYPTERNAIIDTIAAGVKNVVFITGDSHASWAFDVTQQPAIYPDPSNNNYASPSPTYNPATGAGSVAVEFGTPSITSANFDELVGGAAAQLEQLINKPVFFLNNSNYNPHLKYVDLDRHGYFILDLKDDSAQANYFYSDIKLPALTETFGGNAYSLNNSGRVQTSTSLAQPKTKQEAPAPANNPLTASAKESTAAVVFHAYPNPAHHSFNMQYGLISGGVVKITVYDITGKTVNTWRQEQETGLYNYTLYLDGFAKGTYVYTVEAGGSVVKGRLVVE